MPTAPELYGHTEAATCTGPHECHWCGASCTQKYHHGEPPQLTGTKKVHHALRPSSPWICTACWLFRRPRITINFADGTFKDGQAPRKHSWLLTDKALAFTHPCPVVYDWLLKPPLRFALAVVDAGTLNELQLCTVNDNQAILNDTPLHFTINNVAATYTVYGLEMALQSVKAGEDINGVEPGIRELIRRLGMYNALPLKPLANPHGGKPILQDGRVMSKVVSETKVKR